MNYERIYNELVSNAKQRGPIEGYTETHHIIPKSMGGSDDKENLVVLTAREHFIAHWLLYKIHRNHSMACAWKMMCVGDDRHSRYTSHSFKYAKETFSQTMKEYQTGETNSFFGRKHSEETKKYMSEYQKGELSPNYGKTPSDETRAKMSESRKGMVFSDEHRANLSKALTGITYKQTKVTCPHCGKEGGATNMKRYHFDNCGKNVTSDEHRTKLSKANKGKTISAEQRAKISEANKGKTWKQEAVTCPHCGKEGGSANMKRYHFDNCKNK